MLQKLGFKNYKSYKDFTEIEVRPITVFVGPNSSGKSSIIKLIKLLAQSYKYPNRESAFNYEGPYVNLNGPKDLFCNSGSSKITRITIETPWTGQREINSNLKLNVSYKIYPQKTKINLSVISPRKSISQNEVDLLASAARLNSINKTGIDFKVQNGFTGFSFHKQLQKRSNDIINAIIDNKTLDLLKEKLEVPPPNLTRMIAHLIMWYGFSVALTKKTDGIGFSGFELHRTPIRNINFESAATKFSFNNKYPEFNRDFDNFYSPEQELSNNKKLLENFIHKLNTEEKFESLIDLRIIFIGLIYRIIESVKQIIITEFNETLASTGYRNSLERLFSNIVIVPPLRSIPQKYYSVDDLSKYLTVERSYLEKERNIEVLVIAINQSFKKIGLDYTIEIKNVSKTQLTGKIYIIGLIDNTNKTKTNIENVGFGISQIIPIICSSFVGRQRINLIEQPELHLHPDTQFLLAKIFDVKEFEWNEKKRSGRAYKGKYFFETHSEHFIRGFQVMVKQGIIKPKDIAVYYVSKDSKGNSKVKLMEINEDGLFNEEWPSGFFDSAYRASKYLLFGGE